MNGRGVGRSVIYGLTLAGRGVCGDMCCTRLFVFPERLRYFWLVKEEKETQGKAFSVC